MFWTCPFPKRSLAHVKGSLSCKAQARPSDSLREFSYVVGMNAGQRIAQPLFSWARAAAAGGGGGGRLLLEPRHPSIDDLLPAEKIRRAGVLGLDDVAGFRWRWGAGLNSF